MKKVIFLFLSLFLFACKKSSGQSSADQQAITHSYQETTIPLFFEKLVSNHYKEFANKDNDDFQDFCLEFTLPTSDSSLQKRFYTIKILHELFTSESASNGSSGKILNIPYYWHWITPNPRYEITSLKNNQKLNTIKPPKEFSKYKSYADIDRTPFLFLSELLNETNLYSSSEGVFSTFGWCSEREMAFVSLMELLGFKGQVITNSNHSWSEFIVSVKKDKTTSFFKFKVDNTFDKIEWQSITTKEIEIWQKQSFSGQGNWYNQKAHSEVELQKINSHSITVAAMKKIEDKVVYYVNH